MILMSLQGYLIFKDVKVVGYWNSKWLERNLHSQWNLLLHIQVSCS